MNVAEALRQARKLISRDKGWCVQALARLADGSVCSPNEPMACRFCAVGALVKVTGEPYFTHDPQRSVLNRARILLDKQVSKASGCSMGITTFNDTEPHAEVLALFDGAIEEAERRKW